MRIAAIALLTLTFCASFAFAGDWPQFRGPTGMGVTEEKGLPTEWDGKTGKNVLWKAPLPKNTAPYASPIVWRDRVFVTTTNDAEPKDHRVLCFDAGSGKELWNVTAEPGPWKGDRKAGYATPATDGDRVYAAFGTAVVVAVNCGDGSPAWRYELPAYDFDVAMSSSPVVVDGMVVLLCDMTGKKSFVVALDAASGAVKWTAQRPDASFAHSTPVVATVNGKRQLVVSAGRGVEGLDPATGAAIWTCKNPGDSASPIVAAGLVYADGGRGGPGVAVDPTGAGDVTKTHVKWTVKDLSESLGSPVVSGEHLYRLVGDRLRCYRLRDGEELYEEKLPGAESRLSPIATADELLYFASSGKTHVVRAGEKFELIKTNDLGDPNPASAAVSGGRIYLKGEKFLWCVGAAGE